VSALGCSFAARMSQELCWFLDAGNNERPARSNGRRPKSAKARSREKCGTPQSNERYEDCMSAPLSMVSATRPRGDAHFAYRGTEVAPLCKIGRERGEADIGCRA